MPSMKEASKKTGTIRDDYLISSFPVVCQLLPWVSPQAPAPMSALVLGCDYLFQLALVLPSSPCYPLHLGDCSAAI